MANEKIEPQVGMGATMWYWTDRYPGTIIEVTPTRVVVQEDKFRRTDSNGMSESQEYEYETDPEGLKHTFTLRKNGRWTEKGSAMGKGLRVGFGNRRAYHDFSF